MTIKPRNPFPLRTVLLSVAAGALLTGAIAGIAYFGPAGLGNADAEPGWVATDPDQYRETVLKAKHRSDPILALFRDASSRDEVVAFFAAVLNSEDLAQVILHRSEEFDVSPSLAAALSWEESRFDPRATNRNKASVDRGLFQLNSKSFPNLKEKDFYDPDQNARLGIAHLRWCLDTADTVVAGLAMYNAGVNRVKSDTTPRSTLNYISRILSFKAGMDELFARELGTRWLISADGAIRPAAPRRIGDPRVAAALFPLVSGQR